MPLDNHPSAGRPNDLPATVPNGRSAAGSRENHDFRSQTANLWEID